MSCQTPELYLYTSPKLYLYKRPQLSSKLFFLAPNLKKEFVYLFLSVSGLCCSTAMRGLLSGCGSLCGLQRAYSLWHVGSPAEVCGLSSCGAWVSCPKSCGMLVP